MRRIGPAAVIAVLALLACAPAKGGDEDFAGASFLNVPLSVRQMGMGDVSVGGDDLMRAWSNPALLADRLGTEVALSSGAIFFRGQSTALGGALRASDLISLGALLSMNGISFEEVGTDGYETGNDVSRFCMGFGVVGAIRKEWFQGGLAFKLVKDDVMEDKQTAIASDAGVAASYQGFTVGLVGRNLGGSLRKVEVGQTEWANVMDFSRDEFREELPQETRFGVSYTYEPMRITGGVEFRSVRTEEESNLSMGAEWWVAENIAVRMGGAGIQTDDAKRFTMGVTGLMNQIGVDLAIMTHPVGPSMRANVSYAFEPSTREPKPKKIKKAKPRKEEPVEQVAPVDPDKQLNLAVAELEPQNVSAGDAAVIADMIRNALVKTGTFNIVEKKNMDKLLAEQAFQQTGCTSEECAVKLGKLLNVQRILVGSFGSLLGKYFISVRVINVENGKILFGDSAKGETVDEIEDGVNDLALRIAKQAR